jgi:hypothetical protein
MVEKEKEGAFKKTLFQRRFRVTKRKWKVHSGGFW